MPIENHTPYQDTTNSNESLKKEIFRYLKFWKWILLSLLITMGICYLYLRYSPNIYETSAKIKILKKKDSGMDLSGLSGNSPLFDMSKINLENEMQILKSRRLIEKVVNELNLDTYYYVSGRIKDNEVYGDEVPFKVNWLNTDNGNADFIKSNTFIFELISNSQFELKILENSFNKVFTFGEEINIENAQFVIHRNPVFDYQNKSPIGRTIFFNYRPVKSVVGSLLSKINTEPVGDISEVLQIKINGENKVKNEAIVNELIDKFNQDGIEDDRRVAIRTEEFVTERLKMLVSELDTVESDLVDFKSSNDIVDLQSGAEMMFQTYSEAEKRKSEIENQLQITRYLNNEIENNSPYSLLPGDIGINNSTTNSLIEQYNQLVLRRNKLLNSSTTQSPQVKALSDELNQLNLNIKNSIQNYTKGLEISLQNISIREERADATIESMPKKEKIISSIQRQQAVKVRLYVFLLQKKEEAALSSAITAPTAKVVDYAYTSSSPISPNTRIIYLGGLAIGLGLPIGILYLFFLFDTKISTKEQVQSRLNIPVVAEIPLNKEYNGKIIKPTDNSSLAESFRILRTNLNYFTIDKNNNSEPKVFFSTSSTKGEGKTFTAINTASVLASNNKKTLLVGCDLRNPQLHNYLDVSKDSVGLSSYLVNRDLKLEDIKLKLKNDLNFDVIISGEIPPNPSELLNNGRLEELLEEAKKQYDYILVDTAPTMLVTDTLTIFEHADIIIYMVRTNFTELKILNHIKELKALKKLNNLAIAINGVNTKKGYDYNYGYGYGYSEEVKKKKWYQF
ncbi:MAG: polysaccharide biosynthesis tyrosine autokinase [Bacteroidetes bacterium]|jgi:capsular exopolysaccharide synthesis family protein|nr:polysaccharide biosynthesis tyrosine autokinase [Bacteroidota bacterium]